MIATTFFIIFFVLLLPSHQSLLNNLPSANNYKCLGLNTIHVPFTVYQHGFKINKLERKKCDTAIREHQADGSDIVKLNSENNSILDSEEKSKIASKKLQKRWATGLTLGALGTIWIYSGNGPFSLGFLLTSLIAQSEYYTMVKATGVLPAYKTGILSSILCYFTAAMFPRYHELVMPLSATILMIWLLVFNKKSASISEISTSLLGMFFLGYLPSFWIRLHRITKLSDSLALGGPAAQFTFGSCVTWWTWTSIVFADVGAYFIGKKFGKHKLSTISSAAGSASPNKTVEGALAGFASCTFLSLIGAYVMKWPKWKLTGCAYGLIISFIALVGDLTVSMMKRDAGIKDSGNILPGHGGLLDRIDSYLFTAPAAYFFCLYILRFVT